VLAYLLLHVNPENKNKINKIKYMIQARARAVTGQVENFTLHNQSITSFLSTDSAFPPLS
jgi:hypothetical protein